MLFLFLFFLNKSSQRLRETFASAVSYTHEPAPDTQLMNAVYHVRFGDAFFCFFVFFATNELVVFYLG